MIAGTTGLEPAVFAGRAAEFSTLKAAAGAAREGRFAAVLISGEPGIGKSRLAEEACNYARGLGFETAAGHCFDTHSRLSYFPFIQAFRHLARHASPSLPPGERSRTKRASEAAALIARLAAPAPRSARLKPELGRSAQTELFESVACFLHAWSATCPLLLLLENLESADEGSLSLLLHLVRISSAARLLIIGTCQGNGGNEQAALARTIAGCRSHSSCQRIRLSGLTGTEAASLVGQLLGPESAVETKQLAAEIGRLSNGNPVFIHQIMRHLVETGRLSRQSGQWVASSGWESKLAAEDGIREVVDARLARLSDQCRLVLSHAAVLGEEFELGILTQMLPLAAQKLTNLLEEASAAGIIIDARTDETADYAFAHGLIRQSLYERQSRPAKRALHADAARAIEVVHQARLDSHLSPLALHYAKAGPAGDLAKAAAYSVRAGEAAYAVCAYADAARHWNAALKLASIDDRKLRAQLLERLGEASLRSAATPAEAAQYLQAALKLYTELGQESDIARVHVLLVTVISLLSMNPAATDVGQAVSHSRRAEKLLATRANRSAEAELLFGEAIVAHAQFRTEDGLAASGRAMEIGQLLDNSGQWCQAAAVHGHLLWASGKVREGLALMEQARERAEHTRDLKPRFAAAWLLGFSYLLLWDPAAAERTIQPALGDSDTRQAEVVRQVLVAHLGIAHVFTGALARARALLAMAPHRFLEANLRFFEGEWTQAEELLSQQIERSHVAQSKQQHWTASLWLARLKRVQGDQAQALDLLTHTPLMTESLLRIPEEIVTRCELALVRLARGEVAEARSEVRRCRTLLTADEDWRALSAFVDRAEAAVVAHDGFFEEARQLWILAGKVFSKYQLPWEVAETLIMQGTLLLGKGSADEGAANLSAAAQIYRHLDLGARWNARINGLREQAHPRVPRFDGSPVASVMTNALIEAPPTSSTIHSLVTTHDIALLATLIHDAIAHLMNAIDKAAKLRVPIERIADATEKLSTISRPVERLARTLEQAERNSAPVLTHGNNQRTRSSRSRRQKLDRSHDPGRPL
jgi:tetratricopeptide (TPR) repeat protein